MSFRRSVNYFVYHSVKHTGFLAKESKFYCTRQHAEIGLDTSKIMILILKIKNGLVHRKKFEDEVLEILLYEDSCQAQAELTESFWVDRTKVSKRLKALGIITKQGHLVLYGMKLSDIERCLVMWEQQLKRLKRKDFFCIISWPLMKTGYATINLSVACRAVSPAMHQHQQ